MQHRPQHTLHIKTSEHPAGVDYSTPCMSGPSTACISGPQHTLQVWTKHSLQIWTTQHTLQIQATQHTLQTFHAPVYLQGSSFPLHSPNPMPGTPGASHLAVNTTSSPSSKYTRSILPPPGPAASCTLLLPPQVASSRQPRWPSSGPDTVPEPSTSPGCRLQPPAVWCATICWNVQ